MRQARRQLKVMAQQNIAQKGERVVASLWPDEAILVESSSSISDCARLMTAVRADSALVTCNGALCGIITDNDICRRVINQDFDPKTTPIALAMTGKPMTVTPSHLAIDALSTMVDKHFRHLPVSDGTTIYGQLMISKCIGEIVSSLKKKAEQESGSTKTSNDGASVASSVMDDSFLHELGQMTIGEVCKSTGEMPPTVPESAKVREAVRVMSARKTTAVLTVKKDGEVCGILTTKDVLLRVVAAREDPSKTSCSRVHTPYPDMVPHTMTVLEALQHMSTKKYLHLPVHGGESTMADGTSGLVDALQLITHLLRPPLPDLDGEMNQGKDDAVLRKLLRMSGVGVAAGDFSVSDGTSRPGSVSGTTFDDDRSSVCSRSRVGDDDSVSVAALRSNLRKEFAFKLCDLTGRWHRFTIGATYENLLREIMRVDSSLVTTVAEEDGSVATDDVEKENDASSGRPPLTPARRALGTIREDGSSLNNAPSTPSMTSEKKTAESAVSEFPTLKLRSHVQIMYEDDDLMWTVVGSESCLANAVQIAKEQGWRSVQLHLKRSDASPPKQREKPLPPKKEEKKIEMPPPMPRAPAEIRHVEEGLKNVQQRIETLQSWREKSSDEAAKMLLDQQKQWRATQATTESAIRRQIEAVQTRAEKLADDSNAAALKQQQQWSLMHELTMKKISKVAEELTATDSKVKISLAPLELKLQSMGERGQLLASGLDEISEKYGTLSLILSSFKTKVSDAETKATAAVARSDEVFARLGEVVASSSSSETSATKEALSAMESMKENFESEIKAMTATVKSAQEVASKASRGAEEALAKASESSQQVREKHEKFIEMVATLKQQAVGAEKRASEASEKAMEAFKSSISMSGANAVATQAIAELKRKLENIGSTTPDVEAVAKREIALVEKNIDSFKVEQERKLEDAKKEVEVLKSGIEMLRKHIDSLESTRQNERKADGKPLTQDQIVMGVGAMCAVSVVSAFIVSMMFSSRK